MNWLSLIMSFLGRNKGNQQQPQMPTVDLTNKDTASSRPSSDMGGWSGYLNKSNTGI